VLGWEHVVEEVQAATSSHCRPLRRALLTEAG
jgi:hypothetical protein